MQYEKHLLEIIDKKKKVLEDFLEDHSPLDDEAVRLSTVLDAYISEYQRYAALETKKTDHYKKDLFSI